MKTLILIGLTLSTHAFAQTQSDESLYRPYLSCKSASGKTVIEVVQGIDKTAKPFQVSIEKTARGKTIKFMQLTSERIPVKHKNILDLFEGFSEEKDLYRFELTVTRVEGEQGHQAYLADNHGRRLVYCSYHITFGN